MKTIGKATIQQRNSSTG